MMEKEVCLLLVLDGLGDIRYQGKKTPLEKAKTPFLDYLAKNGALALYNAIDIGIPSGSDISHLKLFGYEEKDYPGRGVLEALGLKINLSKNDIAFRANLATKKGDRIIDRRAGRISTKENKELSKAIKKLSFREGDVFYFPGVEHRGVVVVKPKKELSPIEGNDTHKTGKAVKFSGKGRKEKALASLLNKWEEKVEKILEKHEINKKRKEKGKPVANYILLRGGGRKRRVKGFFEKHGLRGAGIAGGPLYKGVARYVGMDVVEVKGATGDKNTNLKAKAKAAIKMANSLKYDFIFLHVKATDSFSHDGDYKGKTRFIERVDKELVKEIVKSRAFSIIIVTADHSTPWSYKEHSGHPVPALFYGERVRKDSTTAFSEYQAMNGGIPYLKGKQILQLAKNYLKKAKLVGE